LEATKRDLYEVSARGFPGNRFRNKNLKILTIIQHIEDTEKIFYDLALLGP